MATNRYQTPMPYRQLESILWAFPIRNPGSPFSCLTGGRTSLAYENLSLSIQQRVTSFTFSRALRCCWSWLVRSESRTRDIWRTAAEKPVHNDHIPVDISCSVELPFQTFHAKFPINRNVFIITVLSSWSCKFKTLLKKGHPLKLSEIFICFLLEYAKSEMYGINKITKKWFYRL